MTWLSSVLLAVLCVAGCSNERKESDRKLSESIDTARRLYTSATALMTAPEYVDTGVTPPKAPALGQKLPKGRLAIASQPAEDKRISDPLSSGIKSLSGALTAATASSDSVKADANLLLGQMQRSLAQYDVSLAQDQHELSASSQAQAMLNLDAADTRAQLAAMPTVIAKLTGKEQPPLQQVQALRTQAQEDVAKEGKTIEDLQAQVRTLELDNDRLVQENNTLLKQATGLRDKGDLEGGAKGLDMLKQAAKIEGTIAANGSRVAANKQTAEGLLGQIKDSQVSLDAATKRLSALEQYVQKMQENGVQMADAAKAFADEAANLYASAVTAADVAAKATTQAKDYETKATALLADAVKRLTQAESQVRNEMNAASKAQSDKPGVKDEILSSLTDDQHLVSVSSSKAAAELALADLYVRQMEWAKTNGLLVTALTDVSGRVGQSTPAAVTALNGYVTDVAALTKSALDNYKAAEKDLDGIATGKLKSSPARATLWMYQGMLARAYLGDYRLTHDESMLGKAKEAVLKATADKENSPYLASVVQLKAMIEEAGGGTTRPAGASAPASVPASGPAR